MKTRTKIILLLIASLSITGVIVGYYLYQKPVKNFADSSADITISAKDLFSAFIKDHQKATSEFVSNDRIIQVKGKIIDIISNPDGTVIISLDAGEPGTAVSCNLVKEHSKKANKFKTGDIITLQGQCTGYQDLINQEVIMMRCGISKE